MWRYTIAYCGWDRGTNSLGITQADQEEIIARSYLQLNSPVLTERQRLMILAWLPQNSNDFALNSEDFNASWMMTFLGIASKYQEFPLWLIGDKQMKQAALLAILRNIVCHGSLLPTKANEWGLQTVYEQGIDLIGDSFFILLLKLFPEQASTPFY